MTYKQFLSAEFANSKNDNHSAYEEGFLLAAICILSKYDQLDELSLTVKRQNPVMAANNLFKYKSFLKSMQQFQEIICKKENKINEIENFHFQNVSFLYHYP